MVEKSTYGLLLDSIKLWQAAQAQESEMDISVEEKLKRACPPRPLSEVRAETQKLGSRRLHVGMTFESLSALKTYVAELQEVEGRGTKLFEKYAGDKRPLILVCECGGKGIKIVKGEEAAPSSGDGEVERNENERGRVQEEDENDGGKSGVREAWLEYESQVKNRECCSFWLVRGVPSENP